jgi:hypothetical protein
MSTKVSLFTAGRTGSQFVFDLVKHYCNGLEMYEWLSPAFTRENSNITDQDFLKYIISQINNPSIDFAIKITPHAFGDRWKESSSEIEAIISATSNTKQVLMYREDFWSVCLSDWIANTTGLWHSNQPRQAPINISFAEVVHNMANAERLVFKAFVDCASPGACALGYESILSSPLTFAHTFIKLVLNRRVSFSSINIENYTKKVVSPDSEFYQSKLLSLSIDDLDVFYEVRASRQKFMREVLSDISF